MENIRIFFAEASGGEIKKLVDNSAQRNTKKSTKYTGTIYVRSPWEIIRTVINWVGPFPACWYLVHRRIMPSAERLSSKFHSCPRSFASRPTVHFSDNISTLGIILRYISRWKWFIYYICICIYIYILVTYIYCCNTKWINSQFSSPRG